jgi:hypothetical protein
VAKIREEKTYIYFDMGKFSNLTQILNTHEGT